jgi:glucose-1-phosphate cytidylyltransferase
MVKIGNRPILWHIMKIFSSYGINEFILALGYKGEMIKEYFYHYEMMDNDITIELGKPGSHIIHESNTDEKGWKITLVNTGEKALKGARLKKIERYITGDEFMVTYGDGLADVDLNELIRFHHSNGALATVTGVYAASRFGELKISGTTVESFVEKPQFGNEFINGGFFVFNKKIFNYLTTEDSCDLEIGALEKIAKDRQLKVFKHSGSWACMDTLRDMEYLNKLWDENKAFWKKWE